MRKLFETGTGVETTQKVIENSPHRSHRVKDNSQGNVENFITQEVSVSNTITAFETNIRVLSRNFPQKEIKFISRINTILV